MSVNDVTILNCGKPLLIVSTACQLVMLFLFTVTMITVTMVAAMVEGTILCMHGGLSPDLKHFEQVKNEVKLYY